MFKIYLCTVYNFQPSGQITHGNPVYSELKKAEDEGELKEILPTESGSEMLDENILMGKSEE